MPYDYNKRLTRHSQELRSNMTPEERHLWYDFLKLLPITVNRQKAIGNYIVDFYIHSAKLVIEIDGAQHDEKKHKEHDEERDRRLEALGIKILRYKNERVNDSFSYVCQDILDNVGLTVHDIKR